MCIRHSIRATPTNVWRICATDCNAKKGIFARHCLPKEMGADFFTKPVQGNMFIKLRACTSKILNNQLDDYIPKMDAHSLMNTFP